MEMLLREDENSLALLLLTKLETLLDSMDKEK